MHTLEKPRTIETQPFPCYTTARQHSSSPTERLSCKRQSTLENEADAMGAKAAQGKDASMVSGKGSGVQRKEGGIQRQPDSDPEYGYYTVTENDPNLYQVGLKLNIPWIELARINELDLIKPIIRSGMVIKYPISRIENTPEYQTIENAEDQQSINEYKRQIIVYLQSICELKQKYTDTWYENTQAKDTNWGQVILETTLSLALGALTAGIGGMIGKLVAKNLSGYIQEGVKSAAKDIVDNLLQIGANEIGNSASSGLAKSALAGLAHTFSNASWAQFQAEKLSLSTAANFSTENVDALREASKAFKKTNDDLLADPSGILQQLTMGYLNFEDNIYVNDAAGVNEKDSTVAADKKISDYKSDINKKDVTENGARMGRLHFKGEISGDIGSPSVVIDEGSYDEMNNATANYLKGLSFSELQSHGVTMSFDLKAWDSDWNFWTDDLMGRGRVAFEIGPRGTFVDSRNYDSDTNSYNTGSEWLSHHFLGGAKELTNPHAYAEKGATKLFGGFIKNNTVPALSGEWF